MVPARLVVSLVTYFVMSIALSAVVYPSVRLRLLLAAFAGAAIAAGAMLAGGAYALAWPGAVASVAAGLFLLLSAQKSTKARRLDISGVGQIRLAVYVETALEKALETALENALENGLENTLDRAPHAPDDSVPESEGGAEQGQVWRLMAGSTLWPRLLVLLLRADTGAVQTLLVWPACVASGVFRPLALACRALAARGAEQE